VAYWRTIARFAHGAYVQKENADCARESEFPKSLVKHHHADLEALGDHLLDYYRRLVAKHGMAGRAIMGELPFLWEDAVSVLVVGRMARQSGGPS